MSSEFEDKLTIANGYPIVEQGAIEGPERLDMAADIEIWRDWGSATAIGSSSLFVQIFDNLVLKGRHPRVAAEEGLELLGIKYKVDSFL